MVPKFVSLSDPASQWTGAMREPAFFAYSDNYLIDVKHGIIMDVEASRHPPSRSRRGQDHDQTHRAVLCWGANLNWLVNEANFSAAYSGG